MDYQKLLKKYMTHVVECEGTDFLHNLNKEELVPDLKPSFSKEERKQLSQISKKIK